MEGYFLERLHNVQLIIWSVFKFTRGCLHASGSYSMRPSMIWRIMEVEEGATCCKARLGRKEQQNN